MGGLGIEIGIVSFSLPYPTDISLNCNFFHAPEHMYCQKVPFPYILFIKRTEPFPQKVDITLFFVGNAFLFREFKRR